MRQLQSEPDHAWTPEQLQRAREELDYLIRALSHDMHANFMLLESSFSRLKRSLDDSSRAETDPAVAHVEACLQESKRFLSDLVDLAKTGSVEMEPSQVDLAEVVDEILFEQRDALLARRVEIQVRRPLSTVWCNRRRLKQVLTNLLCNAVKHGCDPRRPRITISSDADEAPLGAARDGWVSIRVRDNGPGIDPRLQEEIFLPGRRLPQASADGSGMGLAIVRKIVEHYGGQVRIESAAEAGTTFVLSLPTSEASGGQPTVQSGTSSAEGHGTTLMGHGVPRDDHRIHPHRSISRPRSLPRKTLN